MFVLVCIFKFTESAPGTAEMNLIFSDDSTENIMMSAGWILGFRYGRYFHIKRNSHLMSEGIYDGGGDRYIYFCLKDFQRNINTPHIVYFEDSTIRNDILAKINLVNLNVYRIINKIIKNKIFQFKKKSNFGLNSLW